VIDLQTERRIRRPLIAACLVCKQTGPVHAHSALWSETRVIDAAIYFGETQPRSWPTITRPLGEQGQGRVRP
jgi:hypothetical protein